MIRKTIKSLKNHFKRFGIKNSELRTPRPRSAKRDRPNSELSLQRGFTLIEIIIVIVILSIVSGITIKFLIDSLKIYTMTVNQKTLYDEGKLALERMCRDIRDARSITSVTASSITIVRNNATAQDSAGESIRFDLSGSTLRKVKNAGGAPENPIAMADNVSIFAVTNATNEIQLQLTLQLTSGENVTLQTKVYPKNLAISSTYKNFRQYWREEPSS